MTGQRSPYTGRGIVDVLEETFELHDADGDKIGDIAEIGPEYLVVRTGGGLFGRDERLYYVPRSEVAREEGDDWYLAIDKDQLETMGWDKPPTGSGGWDERDWLDERSSTGTTATDA